MIEPVVWLSPPHLSGNELAYVQEAFAANWIAPAGPYLADFERELCRLTGATQAVALSSGTAALHLAMVVLGVKPEDEVLCQSFTFAASANPIVYQNARPIFIDSESESWNMCPELLEQAIRDRLIRRGKLPKAVIVVDLYGMPARLGELLAVCERYGIPLVEDAAEALGSFYCGKACGSFGQLSVLSFNGNKIVTTSGGGALLSDDESVAQKARFLATQARDPTPHYQHAEIGFNYRMSNICAGIGCGQLAILHERVAQRRANYHFYQQMLAGLEGIAFQPEPMDCFSNRWLTCITVDPFKMNGITRETIRLALAVRRIESRPLWLPMHRQPVFADCPFYSATVSDRLFETGLCLPSGSSLTDKQRECVVETILELHECSFRKTILF